MMIRILLVDDQPIVRQGWQMRLALEADLLIVGEAADGRQAVEQASRLQPDVVIMDLEMPVMDGLTALHRLRDQQPDCRVILTSIHDHNGLRARAAASGATFVGKQEPLDNLLAAVRGAPDMAD